MCSLLSTPDPIGAHAQVARGRALRQIGLPAATAIGIATMASLCGACLPDWDSYDPRLSAGATTGASTGSGTGGMGGMGGLGGAGGSAGSSTQASSSSASVGGSGGSGAGGTGGGPAHCGGSDVLTDPFSDGVQGNVWDWINEGGAVASESGGEAIVTLPAGSSAASNAAMQTKRLYDLRGDSIAVEVPAVASTQTTAKTYLRVYYDASNYLELYQQSGELHFASRASGMLSASTPIPYDAMQHRFWRIREDGGSSVYWDTSSDGLMWTNHHATATSMLFPVDLVRIDIGASTQGGEVAPGIAHFDNLDGGGTLVGQWCPSNALTDDFADGVQGRPWWRSYSEPSCTVAENSGRVSISLGSNAAGYCAYASASAFDMTNNSIAVEVPAMVNTNTTAEVFLRAQQDDQNRVELVQTGGMIECRKTVGGVPTVLKSVNYNAVQHRWWRLRASGDTLYFETNNGPGAWVVQHQETPLPIPLAAIDVVVGAGMVEAVVNPGTAQFDNYNLASP